MLVVGLVAMKTSIVFLAVVASAFALPALPASETNGLAALLAEHGGMVRMNQGRIVGGYATTIEQFPFIAALNLFGAHHCAACIISSNRVLSAAHCTFGIPAVVLQIRAGSTYRNAGGQVRTISNIINHPQYNPFTLNNDISVLWIQTLSLVPPTVGTIGLPQHNAGVATGALAQVSGWGALCEGCAGSVNLRFVTVPIVSNDDCNIAYNGGITPAMLCAGFPQGGRDACQGDSGGPLTIGGTLVGVVSWGHGCARPNTPGVYARVAFFRNWINSVV